MDDILVFGASQTEHDQRLFAVLKKLQKGRVTLNQKCEFSKKSVKFLGQILDESGVQADPEKVWAITHMSEPTNTSEMRRFMGMINHLGKFLPNLAEKTQPLRDLLQKKNMWAWGEPQQRAFESIKQDLSTPPVLALYDPKASTIVSADASSYGLGAVLLQMQGDKQLKPVAYASRALTNTERKYAQIEKEALAVTWACERFSDFLVGLSFHIDTDHKPLVPLLGSKNLDELPPCIQRLRMRLMKFTYSISHVPGKSIATADVLSRAPGEGGRDTDKQQNEEDLNLYVNLVVTSLPATEKRLHEIQQHQEADPILQLVRKYSLEGWPTKSRVEAMVQPYFQFAGELTVENGLLLKGCRLVIPKSLQSDIFEKLHAAHQGLSAQLQKKVEKCDICASHRKNFKETLIPTEFPERPWTKVGTDLFQWKNDQYLLVIDYFSRFVEIAKLSSTTAACVVTHLKSVFARHGIPTEVMSDNGPQFSAEYFQKFAKEWGFSHTTSSPRYPQANGEAERAVRTVKDFISKAADPHLALMEYRATPLANGYSPAELLMGRKLRTTVPVMPSVLNPGWMDLDHLKEEEKFVVVGSDVLGVGWRMESCTLVEVLRRPRSLRHGLAAKLNIEHETLNGKKRLK
ncbi:hypothetical protein M9458_055285 [Cirrhinus mrigala]|uniref:Integrase catalytic domain-containing protein n=1 Tax=Cirrhinus mrigala TaxID=683832 RepID=A0ABD0MKC1_CIRMR